MRRIQTLLTISKAGYYRVLVIIAVCLVGLQPIRVSAVDTENSGLYVAPLRQQASVGPGKTTTGSFEVADLTDKPMNINLNVKQFSVNDYSYDFTFKEPENNWVKLSDERVTLQPGQTKKIAYTVTIPSQPAPGGYYFAMVASSDTAGSGIRQTVQVATLLYLTVDGTLIRSGTLENASVPYVVTASSIPVAIDVKNTGNVHFNTHFFAKLTGLVGNYPQSSEDHLLLPGTSRMITAHVASPLIPGVYKLTYGYTIDATQAMAARDTYLLYIPPWSIALLLLLVFAAYRLYKNKKRQTLKRRDT